MDRQIGVDIILSGNMRSGTTSMNCYLSQHPEIYTPEEKETRFFEEDKRYPKGLDEYFKLFEGYNGEKKVASFVGRPYKEEVPRRLKEDLGPVKFVFMLRDPVEWVHSMYYFGQNTGIFDVSRITFSEFIRSSDHGWSSVIMSHAKHLDYLLRYEERFGSENIQCILLSDLAERPHETISLVYDFVGVDSSFTPDMEVRNETQNPRFPRVNRVLQTVWAPIKNAIPPDSLSSIRSLVKEALFSEDAVRPEMTSTDREYLSRHYADHNRRLEQWLGRDLSHWT